MSTVIDNQRFRKLLLTYPSTAIELLWETYYNNLFNFALSLTRDEDASKDIVQETFLAIWANSAELAKGHERSIEHYLVRIVRNKSVSYYNGKKHQSLDVLLRKESLLNLREHSVESAIIEVEMIGEIRKLISTFPKRERECLLMKIDDGMGPDQIACRLNVSRKAVEKNITSANKRLRKWATKI